MGDNGAASLLRRVGTVGAATMIGAMTVGGMSASASPQHGNGASLPAQQVKSQRAAAGPVGEPYHLDFNNAAQKAVVGGTSAAASGAVCATSGGTACAVSGTVSAAATPFVADQVECPNNGIRRVHFQNETVPPGTGAPTPGLWPYVTGSECIPPPPA